MLHNFHMVQLLIMDMDMELTFPLRKISADTSHRGSPLCFLSLTSRAISESYINTLSLYWKFENLYSVWHIISGLPSNISWKMLQLGAGATWSKVKVAWGCHDVGYAVQDSERLICFQTWAITTECGVTLDDKIVGGKTSSGSHFWHEVSHSSGVTLH